MPEEEQNLTDNFAWGVVDLGDDEFTELAAEIGSFKAVSRKKDSDGNIMISELGWHACTKVELGLEESEEIKASFFVPVYQETKAKLTKYATQMRCFDDPITLRGNSETEQFEQLVL